MVSMWDGVLLVELYVEVDDMVSVLLSMNGKKFGVCIVRFSVCGMWWVVVVFCVMLLSVNSVLVSCVLSVVICVVLLLSFFVVSVYVMFMLMIWCVVSVFECNLCLWLLL